MCSINSWEECVMLLTRTSYREADVLSSSSKGVEQGKEKHNKEAESTENEKRAGARVRV